MDMIERIQQLSTGIYQDTVAHRRHFHQFPELSFREQDTSGYIREFLDKAGVPYTSGYAGNGIVAVLTGRKPGGNVLALRAEMDALPVREEGVLSYASSVPGVMHACGHDAHMASLLGTITILKELQHEFGGRVLFVFQPGEELAPGGASIMLEEGALSNPKPSVILGQHVLPELERGKIGVRAGRYMASSDELYLTIRGKGGHAARPADTTDNILAAAKVIVALKDWYNGLPESNNRVILSFGKISGEGATNVIPEKVQAEGTFRCMDESFRKKAHRIMQDIAQDVTKTMGLDTQLEIRKGFPVLVNHEKITSRFRIFAETYLGKENIIDLDERMTSEDFAFYSEKFPSCFYRLGTGSPEQGKTFHLHSPEFTIDERALEIGPGLMAWAAVCFLGDRSGY